MVGPLVDEWLQIELYWPKPCIDISQTVHAISSSNFIAITAKILKATTSHAPKTGKKNFRPKKLKKK